MIRNGKRSSQRRSTRAASTGRLCFNWYRINITIPSQVGNVDLTGATAVFRNIAR